MQLNIDVSRKRRDQHSCAARKCRNNDAGVGLARRHQARVTSATSMVCTESRRIEKVHQEKAVAEGKKK